jgi:hypothetical protein
VHEIQHLRRMITCVQVTTALTTPALAVVLFLVICAFLLVAQFAGASGCQLVQRHVIVLI